MTEELLLIMLSLLIAFNFGHFATLRKCESALLALSLEAKAVSDFNPNDILQELNEEIGAIVSEVVGSLRQPTLGDYLGGVISQFAQMRMMKMLEADGMLPTPETDFEVVND